MRKKYVCKEGGVSKNFPVLFSPPPSTLFFGIALTDRHKDQTDFIPLTADVGGKKLWNKTWASRRSWLCTIKKLRNFHMINCEMCHNNLRDTQVLNLATTNWYWAILIIQVVLLCLLLVMHVLHQVLLHVHYLSITDSSESKVGLVSN